MTTKPNKKNIKRKSLSGKMMARILIVEDDSALAKELKRIIRKFGYKVVGWVQTGRSAIQKSQSLKPDLVLMDVMLKGKMDGIEAAKTIKEQTIPVVFMSAYANEEKIARAKETDPFGYLVKPFKNEELKAVIEVALQKRKRETMSQVHSLEQIHEIQEETEHYLNLVGSMVIGLNTKGNINLLNNKACDILGYKRKELIGKNWFKTCIPKEERKGMKSVFKKVISGEFEPVEHWKNPIIRKNGETRIISWHNATQKNNKGKLIRVLSSGNDITEITRAAITLKNSEERYRIVAQKTGTLVYDYDVPTGRLRWIGDVRKITGYSTEELDALRINEWMNLIHPNDRNQVKKKLKEQQKKIGAFDAEYRLKHKDGHYIHIEEHGAFLSDSKGKATRMLGTIRDVTENKIIREKLSESEEKYRSITENALEMIVVIQDGKFVLSNSRLYEVLGYDKKDINSMKSFVDYIHPEDKQMVTERYQARLMGKKVPNVYSFRIITKNGKIIWAEISATVIKWEGSPAVLVLIEDITERKKWVETLTKFRLGFERSEQIIFTTNTNGEIEYINPQFEKTYGYKSKEVIGKTPRIIKSGVKNDEFYDNFWKKLLNKKSFNIEIVNRAKNGKLINIHAFVSPILSEQGNLKGFMAIQNDITKQVQAEKALKEKVEQMEFMGRTNLKRYKQMMELKKENDELKRKMKEINK